MLGEMLFNVRQKSPLVHNITNYVTVNDCANILLACGASPIMSDESEEVEDITSLCGALNINIGTLNRSTIPAMFSAGARAKALGRPVLLDPVGAGASPLRTETALRLLREVRPTVVRGNLSEIKALAGAGENTHGVDAAEADVITADTLDRCVKFAEAFAQKNKTITAITGAIDIVTDGCHTFCIRGGHPMMSRITGTGCQLSAMTAAYLAANPGETLNAVAAAVAAMDICGLRAFSRMTTHDGNNAYRGYIIDEVFLLTPEELERSGDYDLR